jgi:menaquinone-specific isochorismate synthase
LDAARRPVSPAADLPCRLEKQLVPEKPQWNRMIQKALATIQAGDLQKIVLARKMVITRSKRWDPAEIIASLAQIEEDSFIFYYQIADGISFLGRSPERLFRMQDGRITAEAIAGTRPRGETPSEDQRLERELLHSRKELKEHRFVAGFVETGMKRICDDVRIAASEEILKLKNVQHIVTRFTGRSTGERSPLSIARIFHPTPAVGGYPPDGIPEYLRQNEPFQRGWYGAPIGWMNRMNADFAVGIRSALVRGNKLHIFAGAGIVGQSTARDEWKETEKKMDNFATIVGEFPCLPCS